VSASTDAALDSQAPQKSSLRVLHLHSGNIIGGIESMLRTIAEYAPACPNLAQELALAFDGDFAQSIRDSGLRVHLLPSVQLRYPLSVRHSRRELRALLLREQFDAVISHSPWCQVVYGPALKDANIPVVFWMHGSFDGHWLQRLAARHAPNHVICNSEFSRSTLPRVYPHVSSTILHYPVKPASAIQPRESLRADLKTPLDASVVFMASRMEPWKGHLNLLQAAALIKTQLNWVIWIAGHPQTPGERRYYESVLTEVHRLRLQNRVVFLGHRADVPSLMRAADIFCQPNAAPEPFGIVFVEALQAGVPVVTFDMGGPSEILDASSGFLLPPGDIAGLASALNQLVENPALRAGSRVNGPARAADLCDPVRQLQRLHELISSITSRPEAQP
jgi:glycosyltransferase involved in cell wall biosynthesis